MFTWKRHKDIFKGEGIYHLTFVVHERAPILGELHTIGSEVQIIPTPLGRAISHDLSALPTRRPYCRLLAKQLMPDHIHVLIWLTEDCGVSIKEIARGMRQGWKQLAAEITAGEQQAAAATAAAAEPVAPTAEPVAVNINRQMPSAEIYKQPPTQGGAQGEAQGKGQGEEQGQTQPPLFAAPFIRTLSRKGQLDAMIAYIHDNPRRAMLRRLNPDLFRLRREVQADGLTFTALGNLFLLDYPQRQAVECSRSANEEQITAAQALSLRQAEEGAVTYSGAISEGERRIVRAIREAGFPLVVLLNEGFPAAGSEQEKYYKPGEVYFEACAAGLLLLLEATADTIENPQVVALTEQALRQKAEAKHQDYQPLPHTAQRWRMMANNTIVRLLAENPQMA